PWSSAYRSESSSVSTTGGRGRSSSSRPRRCSSPARSRSASRAVVAKTSTAGCEWQSALLLSCSPGGGGHDLGLWKLFRRLLGLWRLLLNDRGFLHLRGCLFAAFL